MFLVVDFIWLDLVTSWQNWQVCLRSDKTFLSSVDFSDFMEGLEL